MTDAKMNLLRKERRAIESKDGAIEDNINCKKLYYFNMVSSVMEKPSQLIHRITRFRILQ